MRVQNPQQDCVRNQMKIHAESQGETKLDIMKIEKYRVIIYELYERRKKKSTNFYWKLTKKQNKIDKDISEFFLLLEKSCSLFSWWHFTFRMVKSVIGNHEYHA